MPNMEKFYYNVYEIDPNKDIKSIVEVETGIVTLISYHHYLKIVGNNKLWPHMQKESWNIHGTKILISSITLNGTDS
jgi:hypothetical protein